MAASGTAAAGAGRLLPAVEHPPMAMQQTANSVQNHRCIMRNNSQKTFAERNGSNITPASKYV
jgi:hypothetical protein